MVDREEITHVEAVKDSKSMKRKRMRVKHLRGWVDKETHSVTEAVDPKR